jgi:outer membrane receptor protein involved in Fe transport
MTRDTHVARAVRYALWSSALTLAAATAIPAYAQDQEAIETVIVTGSRITSGNLEAASPVQTITAEDINAQGAPNVQDVLVKNPVVSSPAINRTNSNFQTSSVGVSTVDLRGLGTARTLVLVNGRRFVSGVPGVGVDLNTIPSQFIERVDVLTGGASSIYGSDAVAGVVNIIYKKDFQGIAVDGQYGQSSQGDDTEILGAMTFGANTPDGKGNIMGHLGYTKQGQVWTRDRSRSAVDQFSVGAGVTGDPADLFKIQRPFYSSFAPQGRFFTENGPASGYTFDQAGNIIPWSTNGSATLAATGYNRSAARSIAVPTERYLFASRGNYEFIDHHEAFFEGTYASTHVVSVLEPFPLDPAASITGIYPATGNIPGEFMVDGVLTRNPIIPAAIFNTMTDTDGDGLRDYTFTRRLSEVGNRGSIADRDTFRFVTGLNGEVIKDWKYEAYYAWGQTKEAQTSSGQVNVLNFRNALEAVVDVDDLNNNGSTTDAICRDANARAQGCVPINVFGFNSITPEMLKYVEAPAMLSTRTTQQVGSINLTGSVWDLPAGPLGVAIGGEYREEYARSEFDPLQQAGLNAGNAIPKTEGKFHVSEEYAEVNVPLLKDMPGVDMLSVRGAARFSDYSTVGDVFSWTGGLEWTPFSQLRFRMSYAVATRAPNINELFSPPSQTFPTGLQDPCLGVTATSSGRYDAVCRADPGVAANIATNGTFTLNQADVQGISGFDRGNPNLGEETGRSWTIGAVWRPEGLPVLENFGFTLDFYRINISDAIVGTPRSFILDQCYSGTDPTTCSFITRRATAVGANSAGSINLIDSAQTNSGGEFARGIDFTTTYGQDIGPGRLNALLSYTHVFQQYRVPLPGADRDNIAGEVDDTVNVPKDRGVLNMNYRVGKFGGTVQTTYIGKVSLDDQFLAQFDVPAGSVGVGSVIYVDAQFSFNPTEGTEVFIGAKNLLDKDPPPLISGLPGDNTGTETDAATYDPIGRRWYLGMRMKF